MWVTSEAQSSEEFSFMLSEVTSRRNNVGLCVFMYQFPQCVSTHISSIKETYSNNIFLVTLNKAFSSE